MSDRPHIATVLAVALMVASVVNFAILYVVTDRPPEAAGEVAPGAGPEPSPAARPAEAPGPTAPVAEAVRQGDLAQVQQHASWCRKTKGARCDLDKDLHLAATGPSPAVAKALIAAGAKVNSVGPGRETPLHEAASGGKTGIAEVLLQAGADVNARDEDGRTPLHSAAAWGHVELTGLLLDAGADPNALDRNNATPLHLVADRRVPPLSVYARVTRMLLAAGARPNLRTAEGDTALRLARHSASSLFLESNVKATGDANEVVALLHDRGGVE